MMRDRFYNQIVQGLEGQLDPELFERCATGLLREDHPGLTPITGGSDAGMDGAIADGKGEPFPLIATTGRDVIGNLTRSLRSYVHHGGRRRQVVLATSVGLTPRRRRNIEKRARDMGFELVQLYAKDAFAERLYRSPRWCLELLNLPGTPPALSVFPKTSRPLMNSSIVGREKDLACLEGTSGDRLLVGQPGVGKTFLLRKLVERGGGLFVVANDRTSIIDGLRSERPVNVIVDDAQAYPSLLSDLRQIREETGAEFRILASCWPGDEDAISNELALPKSQVLQIDLLTMDEMVDVIKGSGLAGPPHLIQEIVNQAEGKAGLAVTLVDLCRKGAVEEIVRGDAVSRSVLAKFEGRVGTRARDVLAVLALGGDAGLAMTVAADVLELPVVDLRRTVTDLATGGVIMDVGGGLLSVRPPALRHALVRDAFFVGAKSLPGVEQVIASAPSPADVVLTMIGASARGAPIPNSVLEPLVARVDTQEVWVEYAWLGRDQAKWVLGERPATLLVAAGPFLNHVPGIAIPLLLEKAEGDDRQLHSTTDHPLRLLQDWVAAGKPGTGEPVKRRKAVLNSLKPRLSSGRDARVTARAVQIVISPGFQRVQAEPGSGGTVTIQHGLVSLEEMRGIQALWPEIREFAGRIPPESWTPLREMVEDWAYLHRTNVRLEPVMQEMMQRFASEMLRDMVRLQADRPSITVWAASLGSDLDVNGIPSPDGDFVALFPMRDFQTVEGWRKAEEKQKVRVEEMAIDWSLCSPSEMAKRLVYLEEEARLSSQAWPRWTPLLCQGIAERAGSPLDWSTALMKQGAMSDLVAPFLRAAYERGEPDWGTHVEECLSHEVYRWAVIPLVLGLDEPQERILGRTLNCLSGVADAVKTWCLRGQIPVGTVLRLLKHEDPAIAAAAAYGEWNMDPRSYVRAELKDAWRQAVIEAPGDDDYWLGQVFASDSSLAHEWLGRRLSDRSFDDYTHRRAVTAAMGGLSQDQRRDLLRKIDAKSHMMGEMVFRLVGNDLEFFSELLATPEAKEWHLIPLSGEPIGPWIQKACLALDAGYSPEDVARATFSYPLMIFEWVGKESSKWAEWMAKFDALCTHEDHRIRTVGQIAKDFGARSMANALEEERREEIYGIGWRRGHF